MKQKARIADAMLHTPRLLVLDEPMTGLDVRERFRVLRLLDRLRTLASIIFSTHHPGDAAAVCDEILILHRGRAVVWGSPSEITQMAVGHVFETSMPVEHLPQSKDWEVVSARPIGPEVDPEADPPERSSQHAKRVSETPPALRLA
jgi:ABC-type multidrug transport system ATPase subunit